MFIHICKISRFRNKKTGQIEIGSEKIWRCRACAFIIRKKLEKDFQHIPWTWFLTLSTTTPFAPPIGLIQANQNALNKFMLSLKYHYGPLKFFWGWGVNKRNQMHPHILIAGKKPAVTWIKKKWHKLTGNYIVHVKPANANHVGYIAKNAARLPNYMAANSPFSDKEKRKLSHFHRIGCNKGLRSKKIKSGLWEFLGSRKRLNASPTNHWKLDQWGNVVPRY